MGVAQHRARLALVSAVAVLGAACTSPAEESTDDTSNAASSTSTTGADPTPSATYARYEVDPPGPLDSPQYGDDMLLVSAETIPDEVVDSITEIRIDGDKAVNAVEQFSLGSFSLENRSYRIAAVDPAGYRRFTPGQSGAVFQDAWDRVAAGEVAVLEDLGGRIPLDKDDYLDVGSGEQTFPIHLGAWTSQVGTVDAVVNSEWGEALGLPEGNALVINTGVFSPQAVRKKLEKLLGESMSITDLDVVAQYGLEPGIVQSTQVIGTFAEAVGIYRYTPIGGGRVQPDPQWVREHIVTETLPLLGELTCNKVMMPQLREAMLEISGRGLGPEIEYHVGCYYPRFIAGTTTLSNHSFGLAIDINSLENQRGTVGQMHPDVVEIMKKWGFAWGGDWNYTDPMHFELARIVHRA
jgi:hypothetical protein